MENLNEECWENIIKFLNLKDKWGLFKIFPSLIYYDQGELSKIHFLNDYIQTNSELSTDYVKYQNQILPNVNAIVYEGCHCLGLFIHNQSHHHTKLTPLNQLTRFCRLKHPTCELGSHVHVTKRLKIRVIFNRKNIMFYFNGIHEIILWKFYPNRKNNQFVSDKIELKFLPFLSCCKIKIDYYGYEKDNKYHIFDNESHKLVFNQQIPLYGFVTSQLTGTIFVQLWSLLSGETTILDLLSSERHKIFLQRESRLNHFENNELIFTPFVNYQRWDIKEFLLIKYNLMTKKLYELNIDLATINHKSKKILSSKDVRHLRFFSTSLIKLTTKDRELKKHCHWLILDENKWKEINKGWYIKDHIIDKFNQN